MKEQKLYYVYFDRNGMRSCKTFISEYKAKRFAETVENYSHTAENWGNPEYADDYKYSWEL